MGEVSTTRMVVIAAFIWALVLPLSAAQAIETAHAKGSYPSHGYFMIDNWQSVWYTTPADVWVSSDRCKAEEATLRSKIASQLAGSSPEFTYSGVRWWKAGIKFSSYWGGGSTCKTTKIDIYTDIHFDYMTLSEWTASGRSNTYGGDNVSYYTGSSSCCPNTGGKITGSYFCDVYGKSYPCGYHPSIVTINEPRFNGYTSSYRTNFLLHETGHSMGFKDYCDTHNSISRNGTSGCPLSGGYTSLDKSVLRQHIYKNSSTDGVG